jgi:glutamine amidotransferase
MSEAVRVLDYGVGNLRSVVRGFEAAGASVTLSTDLGDGRLVLPGVGAFAPAMNRLERHAEGLSAHVRAGRPLIGICLGMQLLFSRSFEHGQTEGLGIFQGDVVALTNAATVPNMGWHQLQGLGNPYAYFAHSFGVASCPDTVATIEHGGCWVAAVRRGPVLGLQFHPEKSGRAGIRLLEDWLRW